MTGQEAAGRKRTVFEPCMRHESRYSGNTRERRAEVMAEGGFAYAGACEGGRCRMRPGVDLFTAGFVAAHPVYYYVGGPS